MTWKHILAGICGFTLGFWFCMSRDIRLLPRHEVLVSDISGHGLASVRVHQVRQDFAITNAETSSFATADTYGRAAFPSVNGHTSPLRRAIVCGRRMATLGIHAPCGYFEQISVDIPGYTEAGRTETDLPLKSRGRLIHITLQPNP